MIPQSTLLPLLTLIAALVTTALGQIQYKRYSQTRGRGRLYLTLALFVITLPLTYLAVKWWGIGLVYICTSLNYAVVAVVGRLLFNERLSRRRILAIVLIVCGTSIYALGLPSQ